LWQAGPTELKLKVTTEFLIFSGQRQAFLALMRLVFRNDQIAAQMVQNGSALMRHYKYMTGHMTGRVVAGFLLATALLTLNATSSTAATVEPGQMITFQQEGQTFYALSLLPEVAKEQVDASSIVVLFDTSASQQGAYRAAAMQSLQSLLGNLRASDRVDLMAVDLSAKPMTDAPSAPGSAELANGIAALEQQVPLGSTDLAGALNVAVDRLVQTEAGQRTVVYIGDGMSVANLLDMPELSQVVGKLRSARVSVSSFAIGPKTDTQLLAVLANQTGGNIYIQNPMVWRDDRAGITDERAQSVNMRNEEAAGKQLAAWTSTAILWPEEVQFASE